MSPKRIQLLRSVITVIVALAAGYVAGTRAPTAASAPPLPAPPTAHGTAPVVLAFDLASFEAQRGDPIVRGTPAGTGTSLLPKLVLQRLGADDLLVNVALWNLSSEPTRVYPMGIDRYGFKFVGSSGATLRIYRFRPGSLPTPQEGDYTLLHPMSYLGGQFVFRSFYSRTKEHAPVKVRVELFLPDVPRPRPFIQSEWVTAP